MFINSSLKSCAGQYLLPNQLLQEDNTFTTQTSVCTSLEQKQQLFTPMRDKYTSEKSNSVLVFATFTSTCCEESAHCSYQSSPEQMSLPTPLKKTEQLQKKAKVNYTKPRYSLMPSRNLINC